MENYEEKLNKIRENIEFADEKIVSSILFRLDQAREAAVLKSKNSKNVFDPEQEKKVIQRAKRNCPEEFHELIEKLFKFILKEMRKENKNYINNKK